MKKMHSLPLVGNACWATVRRVMAVIVAVVGTVVPSLGEGTHCAAPANPLKMFGHQFYQTPTEVIKQMLTFYPRNEYDQLWERGGPARILEPSAGSGSMLDFMKKHARTRHGEERVFHCCEIDPELNAMLHGKGHTVVGSDFLEFRTERPYDLIIMNPPFDRADEHIIHAWGMLHGELVALCNAETVKNPRGPHGKRLAQLIEQGGKVQYIGQPFKYSARPTDVEVALIRLKRSQDHEVPDWWAAAELKMEAPFDMDLNEMTSDGLVRFDYLDSVVNGYKAARTAFREYMVARERLDSAVRPFHRTGHKNIVKEAYQVPSHLEKTSEIMAARDRQFADLMQASAWASIFSQTNFRDYATAGVERNLQRLLAQQQALVFDRPNIAAMLELLFNNRHELLRQALVETFDKMCNYFKGNSSHWEGWKSNDAHMVARKVVIPVTGLSYDRRWGGSFTSYDMRTDDLDRTMAMLEGRKLSDPTRMEHLKVHTEQYYKGKERSLVTIQDAVKMSIAALPTPIENHYFYDLDNTAESEYFLIRYWKKGTIHIYFKDEDLWARFNREGAQGKGWLPFDPDKVPKPKTTAAERRGLKEMEEIAAPRRARMLELQAEVMKDPRNMIR